MDLIIIAHKYLPYDKVGATRWIEISMELASLGHNVNIITVPRERKSNTIVEQNKNIQVYNTKSDCFYKLVEKNYSNPIFNSIFKNLIYLFGRIIWYDDNAQFWKPFLHKKISELLIKYPKAKIIATGAPFQACKHTMEICNSIGYTDYYLDFQDPWASDPLRKYYFNWMRKKVFSYEKSTIENSPNNIFVTAGLKQIMNSESKNNSFIIENGHGFPLLKNRKRVSKSKPKDKRILYIGTLANGRDEVFIKYLEETQGWPNSFNCKLDIYGRVSTRFRLWLSKTKINNLNINLCNHISKEMISESAPKYDYGLQLNAEEYPYLVSTKLYEYPALGLPIISINAGGEIEGIVEKNQIGVSININSFNLDKLEVAFLKKESNYDEHLFQYAKMSSWKMRAQELLNIIQ
tara:strand:+ start:93 stop:1310 length:1218 start_codon:yes stop_codon:yes gene_type:complete